MRKKLKHTRQSINKKLSRDEFYGHPDILKLTNKINKKSLNEFSYIYIKEKKIITLILNNKDWLDYVGIVIDYRPNDKVLCLRWTRYN
jgi:hypothetical protein